MIFRLVRLYKDIRDVFADAHALRASMKRKHGWMSE
jgi:hypothetical protein